MKVYFHTFGCKANQYDTERMRQTVEASGAQTVSSDDGADTCVINTCTVTNQADADARRFIRKLHRQAPDMRIVVAGCSAALKAAEYRKMPGVVDVVAGHESEAVARATVGPSLVPLSLNRSLDRMDHEPVGGALLRERRGRSRGWLKVQDGCDRKCSFCATRLARGRSRSRSAEEIVQEARALARHHAELVVTGIHIGHYGRDLAPAATLSGLVDRLLNDVPDVRFRLGSIEATEVDDRLIELLTQSDGRLAPHLHMPLQSGSNAVLAAMRRWHTREAYRDRALEIASRLPVLGLGADIIAGFPSEQPEDHEATLALVEDVPFTYLHVFPYSPRDGTAAADLPQGVPQRVAGERARQIRELGVEKGERYRERRAGQAATVVLEGASGLALTEDYLRVNVTTPAVAGPEARAPTLVRGTLLEGAEGLYIDLTAEAHGLG